jgi:PAS domain S-box-containing protein
MKRAPPTNFDLLSGSGDVRALMRIHDWATSSLGHPATWSPPLQNVVNLMLDSKFPMFVAWGASLGVVYNEAYAEILGKKHPGALGRPFQEIWSEIWSDISPLCERALAGEATFWKNLPLVMQRHGHDEQTWFTFSYSPVRDESGAIAGMYCVCTETTAQVLAERRRAFQLELADRLRGLTNPSEITGVAAELLGCHLQVNRTGYGEVDPEEKVVSVSRDWTSGDVPSIAGRTTSLDAFGPAMIAELRSGTTLRVPDIAADRRSAPYAKAYEIIGTRSMLVVPLIKAGRLTSILSVGASSPRCWSDEDVTLAEDVAERTWAAVERARAEAALTRQLALERDRLRTLFAQAPGFMAVVKGPEHVFELVNSAYMRLIGDRDVLGKSVREALPELRGQGFFELLDEVYSSGKPFHARDASVLLQQTPGAPAAQRFVDFVFQPVMEADGTVSGIFVEGYDVTERKLADQALHESEQMLREGLLAGRMAVWKLDIATRHVESSDSAREIFGPLWKKGTAGWDLVHPDDMSRLRQAARRGIEERSQYECLIRMIRPDNGETIWIEVRGKIVCDASGEPVSIRGISLDVTKRKLAEEALRAADRRKDEFLAMLAHELRNPLAPISTAAQILKLIDVDEPRVHQTSAIIARQVDHMTSLIDDLLDVSRVTRGLITLEKQSLDLGSIVASAIEQVRPLLEARHHQLTVHLPPAPAAVLGDRTRLVQVLTNILNNAAKYTHPYGEINLRVDLTEDQVAVGVRDNGIGIPPDLSPHVFELFTQAERSPDRSQGGLGLGLALVKSLMELHGGSVSAHSDGPGRGSEFVVRMPRLIEPQEEIEPAHADAETPIFGAAPRVMVVDDNTDAADSLAMLLQARGYIVSVAYDAEDALEQASAGAAQIFLLDIGLPEMDGYELARRLRSNPQTAHATLIALTGYGQSQDYERSQAAGFDHHLVKPADAARLSALLAEIRAFPL